MTKRESNPQAIFEACLSRLVIARSRKQAIDTAAYELNKSNLPLDWMTLLNEQGESREFRVGRVELLEWQDAEFTEDCHRFKVLGRIVLTISPRHGALDQSETEQGIYRLPRSSLSDKPVIVLSEGLNHYFLTVLQHDMKWEAPMIKVVNPLSKLA